MAAGGSATRRRERDRERAAEMKRRGIVRTTGRCAVCYRLVVCESVISRYTHLCDGGAYRR